MLWQDPSARSRKYRTPPLPSKASRYFVPDSIGVALIAMVFHAPRLGAETDPDARRRLG